jgi:hypothetical protein
MLLGLHASAGNRLITLSGALTTAAGSSPVTSATRTITGNGRLGFGDVFTDGGTPQYSLNGAAFTNLSDATTIDVVSGDTIAVRAALTMAGLEATFFVLDVFGGGHLIEAVALTRL